VPGIRAQARCLARLSTSAQRLARTRDSQRHRTGHDPQRVHLDCTWWAAQHARMNRHRQAANSAPGSIDPPAPPWDACWRVYTVQKCTYGTARC
jgi:hypothetical protein